MQEKIDWMSEQVVDVLVVGYGPVGAALAALLGRYGVRCLVIDRLEDLVMAPRAIALDNEALRILQMVGLDDQSFERYGIQEVRMHSPYLGQFARVNTSGSIDGHPKLVTFYQPSLESALRSLVTSWPSVTVRTQTELLGFEQHTQGVVATLENANGEQERVFARYLVGADGASSRVRSLIGQEFEGESYAEDWLIVDVNGRHNKAIDHVEFICDPRRPSPHMPAPGGRERWEFMLHPNEKREDMVQPEKIAELMTPWLSAEDLTIERQAVYRFHARCCNAFQKERVFLVGDAAHITPPFVGQGLVAGLRDVANLAWKLAWVTEGKATPAILASFDQERRPHAKQMIDLARMMGKLVMPTSAFKAIAVHGLMRLLGMFPLTRPYFEELKIKPANRFIKGLFSKGKSNAGLVRGAQLPQEWLRTEQGMQLSDDVFGSQLLLLGIGIDPKKGLDTSICQAWEAVGGRYLHLGLRGQFKTSDTPFAETMGNAFVLGKACGWLVVVRPDQVVMLDGPAEQGSELIRQALSMFKN
ncbi:bifunctional 3-(3-hydroxy-phenyl)propionate/3-hydroxycinnamic acid hydroxylase [Shewanella profunda]|uniref:bifunctional 3-(3-hydroxy-phenyl)propionate/3-hydroxycinnamic acid hydroxylase n=1 Tax=Shewanella profunda TaxID=254793 RepID=UPI002010C62C|nr:bifunctional 3-(3-hydroxy-phenyl)propionate/3-hydroxycinnamic acid hydroxylase [Shewanella profunda]MCL1089116.1 bifunctional 3-(3-hydroxy-phenyl)propionate/3-hydroxycinnamic acid hydroxylase [Shewanella profunda]